MKIVRKTLKLYWKMFGYPDLPPKDFPAKIRYNHDTGECYIPRHWYMAFLYQNGCNVWQISKYHNTTRERVRQCLWKAYRSQDDQF